MTPRAAAFQGGLAAFGLVLAYSTWQREPERTPGEVVVLQATHNDIERVHYEDGARTTEVERGAGGAEPAVWVKQSASADGKIPARTLRGNEFAEKFLGQFGPLYAARALGALEPPKLKELGLEGSKKKLEVSTRAARRSFTVATSSYGTVYLKDDQDGRVYLMNGPPMSDLESAGGRLVDRLLHDFRFEEFDGVTVIAGGKRRELVQDSPSGPHPTGARLAPKSNPGKIDELASNWHEKLWRLAPIEVLGKGETPKNGNPEVALRVEYSWHGKAKGWIELGRVAAPPPPANMSAPEAKTPPPQIYARTEHTVGWISLPATADDIVKEVGKVVAGP